MTTELNHILAGKRILILGYGKEGQSTYAFLRTHFQGMPLGIADKNENLSEEHPGLEADSALEIITGKDYLEACCSFDLVIKSPGIPYERLSACCERDKITSQTDLFLRAFSGRTIGVTGTKGKSTTTTLIHHMMKGSGRRVILSGNIGIPPLSLAAEMNPDTLAVFEMSSHQLEHITIAPATAVILNVFPEHLDHYKDFTAYKMAKFNISLMQAEGGHLVYHADDPIVSELMQNYPSGRNALAFSLNRGKDIAAYFDKGHIVVEFGAANMKIPLSAATDLPGEHNLLNIMASVLVCAIHGLTADEIVQGLSTYRRLEHRLEYVGVYKGITFYNDSIATIPQATIEALKTLGKVDLLILGGYDRGLDYGLLYDWLRLNPVKFLVFIGKAGERMHAEIDSGHPYGSLLFLAGDMAKAFDVIRENLTSGDTCLLSPAAASYEMFRDFAERGEVFKKMAAGL